MNEQTTILGALNASAYNAGTHNSTIVDLGQYHTVEAHIAIGTLASGDAVIAQWYVNTTDSVAGAVAVAGKSITWNEVAHGNRVGVLTLRGSEAALALASARYGFVRLTVTGGPVTAAGVITGVVERHAPTDDNAAITRGRV
jgi:hypothetical protein